MNKGFLPIRTNWFDRIFISIIIFIGLQFIWMRFIENLAAIEFSMIFGVVIGMIIVLRG
jgi:predicted small integral membrane protein